MNNLFEALTFFFSTLGACCLLLTLCYLLRKILMFIDYCFKEDKKDKEDLIKSTIEKVKKDDKK